MPFKSKSRFFALAAALFGGLGASGQIACNGSMTCDNSYRLTESPAGIIDGRNNVFILRKRPEIDSRVILFKTGIQLGTPADFIVRGRQITISGPAVPRPGDVLTAVYVGARITTDPARSTEILPSVTSAAGDIADLSLQDALSAETKTPVNGVVISENDPSLQAITMVRSLQRKPLAASPQAPLKRSFDGLGDHPLLSSPSLPVKNDQTIRPPALIDRDDSRSLKMLKLQILRNAEGTKSSSQNGR
jgi:hypothetical protein